MEIRGRVVDKEASLTVFPWAEGDAALEVRGTIVRGEVVYRT